MLKYYNILFNQELITCFVSTLYEHRLLTIVKNATNTEESKIEKEKKLKFRTFFGFNFILIIKIIQPYRQR